MKFKKNAWISLLDNKISTKYGIDVVENGKTRHACKNNKPLFFSSEKECDNEIKKLNKENG